MFIITVKYFWIKPFDFISRLSDKESLSICLDFGTSWIDGNFRILSFYAFDFDRQQQEF